MAANLKGGTMKSLVGLLAYLLQDCSRRCDAPSFRDIKTITERVKNEGDSFITITLPAFCSDFERSLDEGRIGPSYFSGFRKNGCRPAFMQAFMSNVFDKDGVLLENPSLDCISSIRQVCLFAKKILLPCTKERERRAEEAFLKCENEVGAIKNDRFMEYFRRVCRIVMSDVLSYGHYEELVPRHGPGTTGEKIRGNSKFRISVWHRRLDRVFPYTEFGCGSLRNLTQYGDDIPINFVEPEDEAPVRVVFVPKTMKTPRVIAIEPVCMQYAQQALSTWIVPRIESGYFTGGHVNFRDQSVNQSLALLSSRDGILATLDMSEASDRVSLSMAQDLYSIYPDFWEIVDACRSRRAKLPSGRVIDLKKFASMGSAMCFPTEAMVFYCAIITSRILSKGQQPSRSTCFELSRQVYVYGDDLIVPANEASTISADLHSIGLKVNSRKSFWNGKFRESCGLDAYDGSKVTPVYLRRMLPTDRLDGNAVVSGVSLSNQLFDAGYYRTSAAIKDAVESVVGKLPTVPRTSAAIGWYYYSDSAPRTRFNKELQRREIRVLVPKTPRVPDRLDDDPALVKCFGIIGCEAVAPDHLLFRAGSRRLTLKTEWAQV